MTVLVSLRKKAKRECLRGGPGHVGVHLFDPWEAFLPLQYIEQLDASCSQSSDVPLGRAD